MTGRSSSRPPGPDDGIPPAAEPDVGGLQSGQIPPNAEQSERALLGAILIDASCLDWVKDIVDPSDFYFEANRTIYETILALRECGAWIDAVVVAEDLARTGLLARVGGAAYMDQLVDAVPISSHVEEHARTIADRAGHRERVKIANRLKRSAMECDADGEAAQCDALRDSLEGSGPVFRSVTAAEYGARPRALGTKARWLIERVWLERGCGLIVAREKCQKSLIGISMCMSIATGRAWFGQFRILLTGPVCYFDGENSDDERHRRVMMVSQAMGIPISDTRDLHFFGEDQIDLRNRRTRGRVAATIRRIRPVLTIFDPWTRFAPGVNVNNSHEVAPLLGWARSVERETGSGVVFMHHLRKPQQPAFGFKAKKKDNPKDLIGEIRGTSDFGAWYDSAMAIAKPSEESRPIACLHRGGQELTGITIGVHFDDDAGAVRLWVKSKEEQQLGLGGKKEGDEDDDDGPTF